MPNQFTGPDPVEQRFWSKVDRSGGPDACWPWTACTFRRGYGVFRWQGKNHRAHKLAWIFTNGPVPESLCVLHDCPDGDNPACCNPSHLWLGTNAQNSADMVAKHRQARGERIYLAKLSDVQAAEIRARYVRGHRFHPGANAAELAREFGVHISTIRKIARGVIRSTD